MALSEFVQGLNPLALGRFVSWTVRIVIVVVVVAALWLFWRWWQNDDQLISRAHTNLIAVDQSSALVTGYARIDLFKVKPKGKPWLAENELPRAAEDGEYQYQLDEVDAFCVKSYEVAIGYPRFAAAVAASLKGASIAAAEVLAANAVSAFNAGRDSARECLRLNDAAARNRQLIDAMTRDGVWSIHARHAVKQLVAFADLTDVACARSGQGGAQQNDRPSSQCPGALLGAKLDQSEADTEQAVAAAYGATATNSSAFVAAERARAPAPPDMWMSSLGTTKLTYSTLVILDKTHKVRLLTLIPLWTREDFIFQKNIAEVTFGASLGSVNVNGGGRFPWSSQVLIQLQEPDVIAIDRWTAYQGFKGRPENISEQGTSLTEMLNDMTLKSLRTAIESDRSRAVTSAKAAIRSRFPAADYRIEFIPTPRPAQPLPPS